ncbi:hypothetical protein D3C73_1251890 [compost metagenome]
MGGGFGEGERAESHRTSAWNIHMIRDFRLKNEVPPPNVGFKESFGACGVEAGQFAIAHQAGLAAGPAEDVVPHQKRRQPPGG